MAAASMLWRAPGTRSSWGRRGRLALEMLSGAVACFLAARVGLEMTTFTEQVPLLRPATGVALVLLVLRGRKLWPAVASGSFAASVSAGAPLALATGFATADTLEAFAGATLLLRTGFSPALKRVRDVGALLILAALLSPVISASIGAASLCLTGVQDWSAFRMLWWHWWIGSAVADLIVAPVLFVWTTQVQRGWRFERLGEAIVLGAALVLLSLAVFVDTAPHTHYPVHYLIFPGVIWCALRLGQHATATIVFGAFSATAAATLSGRGPFFAQSMNVSLLDVELFTSVVAVTGLFLGAAMAERNRAERERSADFARLRQSEERLELALGAGRMGVWEWQIESGRVEWSDTVAAIHGLAPGTFRGTFEAFCELIYPDDLAQVLEAIRQAVAQTGEYAIEFRHVRPDGSLGWIAANGQVIRDESRRPLRMVGVCRDITGHKMISDALRRQAQQLAEADRRKDEFLAILSHELRNPLAPLQNSVELLARRAAEPAVVAHARAVMERQLRHLVRLVDDLLDVARIRSGKIVLARRRMELATAIDAAIELSRPAIDARRHRLIVTLPSEPIWVEADPTRLPQLIANLLHNAAKYTAEGGQISVVSESGEGHVIVRVRDTGIGMTRQELDGVFELFAQARGSEQHAVQGGLGVGLSLAKSLAELHGGSLTACSDGLGRGSEFILWLPAAPVSSSSPNTSEVIPMPTELASRRILIVDDNVDAAESLGLLLANEGHETRVAHGGVQALEVARSFAPQVMILDLGMPGMDGYAVAREVRKDPALARMRLIALSGYGQTEDRRRTAAAGFDAHLVKPIEPDQLNAVLTASPGRASRAGATQASAVPPPVSSEHS